jgi:hypothetical protein
MADKPVQIELTNVTKEIYQSSKDLRDGAKKLFTYMQLSVLQKGIKLEVVIWITSAKTMLSFVEIPAASFASEPASANMLAKVDLMSAD